MGEHRTCPACRQTVDCRGHCHCTKRHQVRNYPFVTQTIAVSGPCLIHVVPHEDKPIVVIADPGHGSYRLPSVQDGA